MNARTSAQHYRQTAVSSAVLDASPHRLVGLMLAGIRERLRLASACIEIGDLPRKGQAISEASLIIGQLDGSLDHAAGGEIAANLGRIYGYVTVLLTEANNEGSDEKLAEAARLLEMIREGWRGIADHPAARG